MKKLLLMTIALLSLSQIFAAATDENTNGVDRYAVYMYANTFAEEFIKQKDTAVLWSDSSVANMVLKKRWINKDYYTEMVAGERWLLLRDVVYYILSLQEEN